jgi:hypothetical protein
VPLTDADRARLEAEGREALKIVGEYAAPVLLALLTGQPVAWAAILLPMGGRLSKVVSPADVQLLLGEAVRLGKLSWLEAKAIVIFLHRTGAVPEEWDPEKGTGNLSPPIPLDQAPPKDNL